jgi:hypothetical protein
MTKIQKKHELAGLLHNFVGLLVVNRGKCEAN